MTTIRTLRALALVLAIGVGTTVVMADAPKADALFVKDLGKKFKRGVSNLGKQIKSTARNVGKKIKSTARNVGRKIKSTAKKAGRAVRKGWNRVKAGAKKLGSRIRSGAKKLGSRIRRGVKTAVTKVKGMLAKAKAAFQKALQNVVRNAKRLGKAAAKRALHGPFYAYIMANRAAFKRKASPLTAAEKKELAAFYPARLLNKVRVLERAGDTGFFNKSANATTYGNDFVIIRKGRRRPGLMKHEMVHVCQYDKRGVKGFAYDYADQYVDAGFSYEGIKYEVQAYGFESQNRHISKFLGYCAR